MNVVIGFLVGVVIGFFLSRAFAAQKRGGAELSSASLTDDEKKVVAMLEKKGRIRNNDVEALLGVSDATATRYLQALEDKGAIIQKGERNAAHYELR